MTATDHAGRMLPTGTVTFLFSDIEGSTRLLHELGDGYAEVLAQHRRILRGAFAAHDGVELGTEGDSFFVAFERASDALAAAAEGQRGLLGGVVQVRMGLHTGEPLLTPEGYVGMVVHRAARIAAAAHGGQVLLSEAVAALVDRCLPDSVTLSDLGKIRLKDLTAPERVYQIVHPELRQSFPPPRSLEGAPNNLPQQTTSFIGRANELAAIEGLMAKTRLLTLTGSGGSGKTRLSLHAAADVLDKFPDGVWFSEFASLSDPALVPQTVATVLGVREEPGKGILDVLVAHLSTKCTLLLLDNCEHLLEACARLAAAVVRHCPGVTILATSREALGIAGEQIYRVPSLSLPNRSVIRTPQALSMYESVQLFIDRALLVRPDFEVTNHNAPALASLCHHVDGIPLAIELAAARLRSLSVEEIDSRLDQRFRLLTGGSRTALPRHQTLRALIDWSYDLLHDPERRLLQRLSVFAGGWTLEAAEAVCGEEVDGADVLDLLTSLADKSLVLVEPVEASSRYRLLETVRQYATERLMEGGIADAARTKHREYFLARVEETASRLAGSDQGEWLRHLDVEHENLRASLEWSLKEAGREAGVRLCGALQSFWVMRGYVSEGREWCARHLESASDDWTPARAKALNAAGVLACFQGDYPAARASHSDSLTIKRRLGDRKGIADSLHNLAIVACDQCDFSSARSLFEEALEIRREQGDSAGIASALNSLGTVSLDQGEFGRARTLYEESLAISRSTGHRASVAMALGNLGLAAYGQRDFASARLLFAESLTICREVGDEFGIAFCLSNLGAVESARSDYRSAEGLYRESLALQRELGDRKGMAYSLEGMAECVVAMGGCLRGAAIWGAAKRLRIELESPLPPIEMPRYEKCVAAARVAAGNDRAFDHAWHEGSALTLEQALDLALQPSRDPK